MYELKLNLAKWKFLHIYVKNNEKCLSQLKEGDICCSNIVVARIFWVGISFNSKLCTVAMQYLNKFVDINHVTMQWKLFRQQMLKDLKEPGIFLLRSTLYSRPKKKRNTPIYFNTNYRTKMKLVPIIMDYCLLQFEVLKFFLGVRLHGWYLSNFNLFKVTLQIFQQNRKVHISNCLKTKFHNISNISLRVIRRRNYS